VSEDTSIAAMPSPVEHGGTPAGSARHSALPSRYRAWLPSWGLITAKHLELRKRRGVMLTVVLLTLTLPVLVLGFRLAFHLFDAKSYGPAGTPGTFQSLINPMAEFGFIVAAVLGATAGTSDLTEGMFRHLVITGRSRVALYLSRIPAGLAIVLPLVALAFALVCLVTSYEGVPQPASLGVTTSFPAPSGGPGGPGQAVDTITVPVSLSQAQLESWLVAHPQRAGQALGLPAQAGTTRIDAAVHHQIGTFYTGYTSQEASQLNPPVNEMAKIGLWLWLEVGIGFLVGLGLGSLIGQRTVTVIVMIALEIILTPIFAATAIPYFLNGQRLDVGIALDQLRPAGLASGQGGGPGGGGPGHALVGGRGVLNIPPMPTWAMISVIVGWIVGWSVIGAWRMATRDA
jgi:ABC-type transport system involved in multi-copper enzyme maturation permease subunit